jgi:HSP20 family protein
MLSLTRWTPFTELSRLHRDLDRLFDRVLGQSAIAADEADAFVPAADVVRRGDAWVISMALPGVAPEQIAIEVAGRSLRVHGERTLPKGETAEPVVGEIRYGRFERQFTLPEEIDTEHVQATYRHGMLELTLPVREGARPRRIEVQTTPVEAEPRQAAA